MINSCYLEMVWKTHVAPVTVEVVTPASNLEGKQLKHIIVLSFTIFIRAAMMPCYVAE